MPDLDRMAEAIHDALFEGRLSTDGIERELYRNAAAATADVQREGLVAALVGEDPLDPRWTWLPGVIERLEVHADADEDPSAMRDGAVVLREMYEGLRVLLSARHPERS